MKDADTFETYMLWISIGVIILTLILSLFKFLGVYIPMWLLLLPLTMMAGAYIVYIAWFIFYEILQ